MREREQSSHADRNVEGGRQDDEQGDHDPDVKEIFDHGSPAFEEAGRTPEQDGEQNGKGNRRLPFAGNRPSSRTLDNAKDDTTDDHARERADTADDDCDESVKHRQETHVGQRTFLHQDHGGSHSTDGRPQGEDHLRDPVNVDANDLRHVCVVLHRADRLAVGCPFQEECHQQKDNEHHGDLPDLNSGHHGVANEVEAVAHIGYSLCVGSKDDAYQVVDDHEQAQRRDEHDEDGAATTKKGAIKNPVRQHAAGCRHTCSKCGGDQKGQTEHSARPPYAIG